jgi:hypothetical protein
VLTACLKCWPALSFTTSSTHSLCLFLGRKRPFVRHFDSMHILTT